MLLPRSAISNKNSRWTQQTMASPYVYTVCFEYRYWAPPSKRAGGTGGGRGRGRGDVLDRTMCSISCTAVVVWTIDTRIPTMPGGSMSGFHRPDRGGGGGGSKASRSTESRALSPQIPTAEAGFLDYRRARQQTIPRHIVTFTPSSAPSLPPSLPPSLSSARTIKDDIPQPPV